MLINKRDGCYALRKSFLETEGQKSQYLPVSAKARRATLTAVYGKFQNFARIPSKSYSRIIQTRTVGVCVHAATWNQTEETRRPLGLTSTMDLCLAVHGSLKRTKVDALSSGKLTRLTDKRDGT